MRSRAGKANKTGRNVKSYGTFVPKHLVDCDAWRSLPTSAQAVYLILRFEWRGNKSNNNGKLSLSYRQAAHATGVSLNTAARAFHELQAKGFVVVTQMGRLGVEGVARGPTYELTDIAFPPNRPARLLFQKWTPGNDFPIARHAVHNAEGRNGREILSSKQRRTHHKNGDVLPMVNGSDGRSRHQNGYVQGVREGATVIELKTSLITRGNVPPEPPSLIGRPDWRHCTIYRTFGV